MDDHDDPFKGMVDDGEDDSAIDELEFDLNQLHEARQDRSWENAGQRKPVIWHILSSVIRVIQA